MTDNRRSERSGAATALQAAGKQDCLSLTDEVQHLLRALSAGSRDVRLRRAAELVGSLQARLHSLEAAAPTDPPASACAGDDQTGTSSRGDATWEVLAPLIELRAPTAHRLCEALLDGLIQATGAQKGYVLFCSPESTEAEVVAARNVESTNLSLDQNSCSRTLLAETIRSGRPVVLDDADEDERFSGRTSVRELRLRSVLAVPLLSGDRAVGAIYLEDGTRAGRFGAHEVAVVTAASRFAVFYLHNARLLPATLAREDRVFLDGDRVFDGIVGRHESLLNVLAVVRQVADLPATVLLEGESGTGKDLIARALHFAGARRSRPFVAINCAAIPDGLLESELFGHEKGAFTGASSRLLGRVETAHGGTLFLDEVSEVALPLQAKLLRFLQSGELQRLGGRAPISVDVRIVAATSKDLRKMMEAGRFQEALYYRLSVIPVRVPALRERRSDIPLLVDHFRAKYAALYGRDVEIDDEVYERLQEYDFPGNVRELENLMQRLIALSLAPAVRLGDLPAEIVGDPASRPTVRLEGRAPGGTKRARSLDEIHRRRDRVTARLAEEERALVQQAVSECGGNITLTAARLGCHRVTLHRILARGQRIKS